VWPLACRMTKHSQMNLSTSSTNGEFLPCISNQILLSLVFTLNSLNCMCMHAWLQIIVSLIVCFFLSSSLTKDEKQRPKYNKLLVSFVYFFHWCLLSAVSIFFFFFFTFAF
jgi:hypothetical protein